MDIESIKQLDVETGLEYCANDMDFYIEMLKEYVNGDKREELQKYYESRNWKDYQIAVHAIKSTSLTVGARELSEEAKALEFACKDSDFGFIEENHDMMMKHYGELLGLLEQI